MKDEELKHEFVTIRWWLFWMWICLFLVIVTFFLAGCTTLGIADRESMMQKWRGGKVDVELLDDINGWGNWYSKGEGACVEQAKTKALVLKELGIPYKIVHCAITRDNPWNPTGHRFLIAQLNGKDYVMDNGVVQDVVWEYEAVKRSTWGVTNWRVE